MLGDRLVPAACRQPGRESGGARPTGSARDPRRDHGKEGLHRGAAMQPRDMFDIACVMKTHGLEYLDEVLKAFQDKCEAALKVARQMNPQVRRNHHDETSVPRDARPS